MKKTNYKVMTSHTLTGSSTTWQRVYVNENGERFVKKDGGYKCIEGTPCLDYTLTDEEIQE